MLLIVVPSAGAVDIDVIAISINCEAFCPIERSGLSVTNRLNVFNTKEVVMLISTLTGKILEYKIE